MTPQRLKSLVTLRLVACVLHILVKEGCRMSLWAAAARHLPLHSPAQKHLWRVGRSDHARNVRRPLEKPGLLPLLPLTRAPFLLKDWCRRGLGQLLLTQQLYLPAPPPLGEQYPHCLTPPSPLSLLRHFTRYLLCPIRRIAPG